MQLTELGKGVVLEPLESRLLLSSSPVAGPIEQPPDEVAAAIEVAAPGEAVDGAPLIEHTPAASWPEGEDLSIDLHATDAGGHLKSVMVYYRPIGDVDWQVDSTRFFGSGPSDYTDTVIIDGSWIAAPGLEYYVEAVDDEGLASTWAYGDAENPYVLTVGSQAITAEVDLDIDVINLAGGGKWVTLTVELPADSGASAEDIALDSLTLNGISAATDPKYGFVKNPAITDVDGDGLAELTVKFDRQALQATLSAGEDVPLELAGTVGDTLFEGVSAVTVIGTDRETRAFRKASDLQAVKPGLRLGRPDPIDFGQLRRGPRRLA